ncbi:MAG: hypothetical protein HQL32_11900 [Planctomycetes bacterium]|nr:hypothetical protein [Planctomycetota bacterium]
MAEEYSTIGPSGSVDLNVNGLACGIEMYFGSDILTNADSGLVVQWEGYDDKLKQYQGEVLNKNIAQSEFRAKLSHCQGDPPKVNGCEWNDMDEVLKSIFKAFNE